MLGPMFEHGIATRDTDWEENSRSLESFWSSGLLAGRSRHGTALVVTLAIPDLVPAMFERWLTILHLTCCSVFEARTAGEIADRTECIARRAFSRSAGT